MSADVLRDLARAKAAFQLRVIEAIIHGPASGMEARSGETGTGSTEGDSPTAATSGGDARKDHP